MNQKQMLRYMEQQYLKHPVGVVGGSKTQEKWGKLLSERYNYRKNELMKYINKVLDEDNAEGIDIINSEANSYGVGNDIILLEDGSYILAPKNINKHATKLAREDVRNAKMMDKENQIKPKKVKKPRVLKPTRAYCGPRAKAPAGRHLGSFDECKAKASRYGRIELDNAQLDLVEAKLDEIKGILSGKRKARMQAKKQALVQF